MQNFDKRYKSLNSQQRLAVDTIDGPLLVLAGPGTGKTELLSARVANILIRTDTDPTNIICLTFTVNATNNMRDRLRKMIGTRADQVVIKTFHSLAADIIASNPEYFYAGAVLNPISEIASQQIMQSILDTLPHDNPLASRFDNKYTYLTSILGAISKTKDAGLSPSKLREAIGDHKIEIDALEADVVSLFASSLSHKTLENLVTASSKIAENHNSALALGIAKLINDAVQADLPTGKSTQTGKVKAKLLSTTDGQKTMGRERRANNWWASLVEVYKNYQEILYKRGYMDYSDMLIGVIDALESNDDLRFDIQESTQYLLIDEFQDSNEAQIKLMHILADNPHIQKPNVMVVGDPNQTIYGFNGAMLDNTSDFQRFYNKELTTVELSKNYRSSQNILDTSKSVITPYTNFHPELHAENEPARTKVDFTDYQTEADQAVLVSQKISSLLSKNNDQSVAVLARKHESLAYLSRYLMSSGLTVNYEQSIDIRETQGNKLVIDVLALIHAVISGNQQECDFRLSKLIRHPTFGIDSAEAWKLALQSRRSNNWLDVASNNEHTRSLTTWVQKLVTLATSQSLHVLIEQMLTLEFQADRSLYKLFYESKYSESAVVESQATRQLLEIAKQFAQTEHPKLGIFLDMLQETSNKLFMFGPSTGHYENAVTLITVHGAKGLEYDHVFIIDCDDSDWKAKSSRYPIPLSLPIHISAESPADYARLMYVAMTRARQTLHMSYVSRLDSKTTALPAEQLSQIDFVKSRPAPIKLIAKSEVSQIMPPQIRPKDIKEILSDKLASYTLSATHLTNFLDISRGEMGTFIEDNLIRFPSPASETFAHGNAMHAAMELAQIQTSNGKINLKTIKNLYSHKIAEEYLSSVVVSRLTSRAFTQLDALFGEVGLKFSPTSKPEQSYSATLPNGTSLYGKIDRIDTVDEHTVRIADYKTGKPITSPNSKAQDILLKQWRHRLQLGFYVLLMKQQKTYAKQIIQTQIIQLDAGSRDNLYLDYSLDDHELAQIEKLAVTVYKRIKSLDFPDVSSYTPDLSGIEAFTSDLLKK